MLSTTGVCHCLSLLVGEVIEHYSICDVNKQLTDDIRKTDRKYVPPTLGTYLNGNGGAGTQG